MIIIAEFNILYTIYITLNSKYIAVVGFQTLENTFFMFLVIFLYHSLHCFHSLISLLSSLFSGDLTSYFIKKIKYIKWKHDQYPVSSLAKFFTLTVFPTFFHFQLRGILPFFLSKIKIISMCGLNFIPFASLITFNNCPKFILYYQTHLTTKSFPRNSKYL